MPQINRQLLSINDELYLVKRILKEELVKDMETMKEFLQASHVFKKEFMFYFCDKINELEEIQETEQEQLELEAPQEIKQEQLTETQETKQEQSI